MLGLRLTLDLLLDRDKPTTNRSLSHFEDCDDAEDARR